MAQPQADATGGIAMSGLAIKNFGGVLGLAYFDPASQLWRLVPNIFRFVHGSLAVTSRNVLPDLPYAMAANGYCELVIDGLTYSTDAVAPLFSVSDKSFTWLPNAPGGFPLLEGTPITYVATI